MAWWLVRNAAGTFTVSEPSAAAAAATGTVLGGPYATQAQARAGGGGASSSGGHVGNYSYAQLEGLWINAGGSPTLAPLMAAIAEAESGGNPNATGGVGEKGLWQINPAAWGNWATYDPAGNARAAVHVYQTQGLGAWSTYNSGAYKGFISGSTTPDTNVPSGGAVLTGTSAQAAGSTSSQCLVGGGGVFPCLLNASQARALVGGACLAAAALVATVGLAVLLVTIGGPLTPYGRVLGKATPKVMRRDSAELELEPAEPSPAPAPVPEPAPASRPAPKVRVGGSQVSQDFYDQYLS